MENKKKISSKLIIFIGTLYNINYGSLCYSSFIMNDFKKVAWIIPLITIIPFIILIFLYKPTNNLKVYKESKLFKISLLINSFINSALWIYLSSQMMGVSFYNLTQVSFFAIASIIVLIILSNMNLKVILRLGVLFTTGFIFFVPLMLDYQNTYQPYLDIIGSFDFTILKGLYFITIVNELFLYTITNDWYDNPISKKQLLISGLIVLVITSLQIIDSYALVSYKYYDNLMFPSLNRYFSHKGDRFVEHYDTLLLFIMLITSFYKSAHYVSASKYFLECKNTIFNLFFFSFLIIVVFIIILNQDYIRYYINLVSFFSIFLTIIIVLLSRKGVNNEHTRSINYNS